MEVNTVFSAKSTDRMPVGNALSSLRETLIRQGRHNTPRQVTVVKGAPHPLGCVGRVGLGKEEKGRKAVGGVSKKSSTHGFLSLKTLLLGTLIFE